MKKKILKVLALVVAIALIICIGVFANSLVGNPVSKYLATKSANEYIEKTYSDKDFVIEEVTYDFKTGGYYARVTSPTSIDSHFSLSFNWLGKLVLDCYDDDVTTGWNTAMRLEDDYRNAVKAVTESKDFSEKYFIAYGEIPCVLSDYIIPPMPPAGIAGAGVSSLMSVITHSVVRNIPATEAAFSRATRDTLVGSITPASSMFTY